MLSSAIWPFTGPSGWCRARVPAAGGGGATLLSMPLALVILAGLLLLLGERSASRANPGRRIPLFGQAERRTWPSTLLPVAAAVAMVQAALRLDDSRPRLVAFLLAAVPPVGAALGARLLHNSRIRLRR